MAVTAFTSTAIIDATTIGKTVLTASSEGIAADAIGLGATDDVTFNSVSAVDGDFSGTVKAPYLSANDPTYPDPVKVRLDGIKGYLYGFNSIVALDWNHTSVKLHRDIHPVIDAASSSGLDTNRWSNTYSVDGSFSGNLNVEDSGSQRVYGLGTEGDTDSEYLSTKWDVNTYYIEPTKTGSGAYRNLYLQANNRLYGVKIKTNGVAIEVNNQERLSLGSSSAVWTYNQGSTNGSDIGTVAQPFGDCNLSGSIVVAANVDFTGLPTVDPLVAGRLWNHNDHVKISAG